MSALYNGEPAGDWGQSRGLHYGDGVFRTLLAWDGRLVDWDRHMRKLSEDCAALDLAMPAEALLKKEAEQLAGGSSPAVLKLLVMRRGGGRGYRPQGVATDRLVARYPAPRYPLTHWEAGVSAFRCSLRLAAQPALAGIKHLNRLEQVLASRNWPDGADEGILCDQEGRPICGTRTNLFWIQQGTLLTPDLNRAGVSGIMRSKIIELSSIIKVDCKVRTGTWDEFLAADEAFVCNAVVGIWPLRRLENRQWRQPGAITCALMAALRHPRLT